MRPVEEQPKEQPKKKLAVRSVKHIEVKTDVRAGTPQNNRSSKNANNGG